jgi:hypothetical protein
LISNFGEGSEEVSSHHNPEDNMFKILSIDPISRKMTGFVDPNHSGIMEEFANSSNEFRKSDS